MPRVVKTKDGYTYTVSPQGELVTLALYWRGKLRGHLTRRVRRNAEMLKKKLGLSDEEFDAWAKSAYEQLTEVHGGDVDDD